MGQQIGQLRGIARFTELSELLGNLELAVDLVRAELRRRRDSADAQIQARTLRAACQDFTHWVNCA